MKRRLAVLIALAFSAAVLPVAPLAAQLLGSISFPTSGAEEAQADFVEGVLYLHNFEYEDAARAFRRAQERDPDFAMAYWGEAMTHNHPLWSQQDREAARAVLERLAESPEARAQKAPTDRERAYLRAVEALFGLTAKTEGLDKETRDRLYRDELRRLAESYPQDHEASAFYALSILGTSHGGRDFAIYMRAAGVAQRVWDENRQHPGAAHYLIHSFDDPVHAPLGLPMARAYSRIAPAAAHAQHMTSHIFVALGMWAEVSRANEIARRVQTDRQIELGEKMSVCSHYPYWQLYGYLQQGRLEEAATVLDTCEESLGDGAEEGQLWTFRAMRARYVIDSGDWEVAERWEDPAGGAGEGAELLLFTDAYSAWKRQDKEAAGAAFERLADYQPSDRRPETERLVAISRLELEALFAIDEGEVDRAVDLLRQAAQAEAGMPYAFGPPELAKPAAELLGEVLAEAARYDEAREAFATQLERTPQRTTALAGLARVADSLGDSEGAAEARRRLAGIWSQADDSLAAADPR